jgi:hypothetical protein
MPEQADLKKAADILGSMESIMRQKTSSQNIGPQVDPWPGPKSGVVGVLE